VFDVVVNGRNYWTPQLERMFGLEPGSFGGTVEEWAALVHHEDRDRALRAFREALKATGPLSWTSSAWCARTGALVPEHLPHPPRAGWQGAARGRGQHRHD
jgi:hypothetical protein